MLSDNISRIKCECSLYFCCLLVSCSPIINVLLLYLHTGNNVRQAGLGYVGKVGIYYNYLSSPETAVVNIMLPYYLLSYGLCTESPGKSSHLINILHNSKTELWEK